MALVPVRARAPLPRGYAGICVFVYGVLCIAVWQYCRPRYCSLLVVHRLLGMGVMRAYAHRTSIVHYLACLVPDSELNFLVRVSGTVTGRARWNAGTAGPPTQDRLVLPSTRQVRQATRSRHKVSVFTITITISPVLPIPPRRSSISISDLTTLLPPPHPALRPPGGAVVVPRRLLSFLSLSSLLFPSPSPFVIRLLLILRYYYISPLVTLTTPRSGQK